MSQDYEELNVCIKIGYVEEFEREFVMKLRSPNTFWYYDQVVRHELRFVWMLISPVK